VSREAQQLRAAVAAARCARQLAWALLHEAGGDPRDEAYRAAAQYADDTAGRVQRLVASAERTGALRS